MKKSEAPNEFTHHVYKQLKKKPRPMREIAEALDLVNDDQTRVPTSAGQKLRRAMHWLINNGHAESYGDGPASTYVKA